MSIRVQFKRDFTVRGEPGDSRFPLTFPRGRTFILEDEDEFIGLLAVSEQAADALDPLTEEQEHRVTTIRLAASVRDARSVGDDAEADRLAAELDQHSGQDAAALPKKKKKGE